jgi:hypothetical protein
MQAPERDIIYLQTKGCARLKRTAIRSMPLFLHILIARIRWWPGPSLPFDTARVGSFSLVPGPQGRGLLRRRVFKLAAICFLIALSVTTPLAERASANPSLPGDVSYKPETTWILPGLPHLSDTAGYIPHNLSQGEAVFALENETIHGFRPGKDYLEMYVRDIAWGMETTQYYYPDEYLRQPIEAFLRRQYTEETVSADSDFDVLAGAGAVGGIITPEGYVDKQTITSDEETSLIHAAYLYYSMTGNVAWLESPVGDLPVIERLNRAADWLVSHRFDADLGLFWRGHTVDWGDVKFEESSNYTDYDPEQDHRTASIYDQALAYMALSELADMNAAVGDAARASEWRDKANALKEQTNARLWRADKGFYLTHLHITPLEHDFDESAMVSISNALAIYAGLTDFDQSRAILDNLERVRVEAGADKPGLSIYPYYPNQWPDLFFDYLGMGYGNYQNGGVWDWWGGVQIQAELVKGFASQGTEHLLQVANDWHRHPGNIIEWQSTTDPEHQQGSDYYSAAAGTVGHAIIEGLFGIQLSGRGLVLQPRLGLKDAFVRVYQPATDRYAAYRYDWDQDVVQIDYGTNVTQPVSIKVLTLRPEQVLGVSLDGRAVAFSIEGVGDDAYVACSAPSGQHSLRIMTGSGSTGRAGDSVSPTASIALDPGSAITRPRPTQPSMPETPSTTGRENRQAGVASAEVSGAADPGPTVDEAWESDLRLIHYVATGLVVLSSLGLIVLITVRRRWR